MKKIAALAAAALIGLQAATACAVDIDWGAILNERKAMINSVDFEIYYQGSVDSAPYYGAKFEPRGGTYFGCVTENKGDFDTQPGAYLTFFTGNQQDIYYPANQIIKDSNAITVVEFTANNFEDFDINSFATAVANLNAYGKPMLISVMNEMNTSNLQYDSVRFVNTFRQAADIIHQYPNLGVVWSPVDLGSLDKSFEQFYPGDEYVDWIGVSSFELSTFTGKADTTDVEASYFMTGQYSWATNRIKPLMQFIERNNIAKPVMITQGGVSNISNVYGDIDWWAAPRLKNRYYDLIMKYPNIKLINYFNEDRQENESFDFINKPGLADIVDTAVSSGAYITSYGGQPQFVYRKTSTGGTYVSNDGYMPIYVQAYVPGKDTNTVHYEIDGVWYHYTQSAPYTCYVNIAALSDGNHTITAKLDGMVKTSSFTKTGNTITFW